MECASSIPESRRIFANGGTTLRSMYQARAHAISSTDTGYTAAERLFALRSSSYVSRTAIRPSTAADLPEVGPRPGNLLPIVEIYGGPPGVNVSQIGRLELTSVDLQVQVGDAPLTAA